MRSSSRWCSLAVLGVLLAGLACDAPPGEPSESVPPPTGAVDVDQSTPAAASRSLLTALRDMRRAAVHGDRAAVAAAEDAAAGLIDPAPLLDELKRRNIATDADAPQLIQELTDNWAATIAYYAESLDLDQLDAGTTESREVIVSTAVGPGHEALLCLKTRLGEGDRWRISAIYFSPPGQSTGVPPGATASASTAPAVGP